MNQDDDSRDSHCFASCPTSALSTKTYEADVRSKELGYLFTSDSFDRQVDHRIYRLIRVAVNFRSGQRTCLTKLSRVLCSSASYF